LFEVCELLGVVASASGDWAVGKIQVILGTIKLLSQQGSSPWNLVKPFLNEPKIVCREQTRFYVQGVIRRFAMNSTLDRADSKVMLGPGIVHILGTVRNGTAWLPSRCHDRCMLRKKRKKEPDNATHASVKKEMAKPRMAKSVRIAELNLDTARISDQPSATMRGTVDKIIPSPRPSRPEKAQIGVGGADVHYRDLRIENTLTDEHGDEVKLKKGAHVEVTVTANRLAINESG
jgi:hypothetical protein